MSLSGSTVVVLGGSSGIGFAVARAVVAAGARVVIASSSAARVEAAVAQLGPTAGGHAVDASDSVALDTFFAAVGPFDHLVYTAAGTLTPVPLTDYTAEAARDFFSLRLVSGLDAVRAALPTLAPSGSITLTSGSAAHRSGAGWVLGAAASGAMISATRSLAVELAPIRVNVVAPGVVRSPLWAGLSAAEQEAMYAGVGASVPLGRVAEVDDVAKAYLYAMEQHYATGSEILVDGGSILV
ncbi:SDR family oxidoreductase [Herbiconiux ginsengi]|uniref:NAD(P)-dependent dehydrogenase, short-chain alcohol dehydrogenase family n=1 Tax=Herbiconiux ginsengi TaxID=381665 RepID=A0A1H3TM23_9MICO|nr:SDR family oxidoreductase [Herbiconiux ginsengi]SDZ51047.1 NAD(P)-dependent dehydrogenase, short-chain alcohol dehydrogenase family [Herbiconiux ginsengi]